MNNYLKNCLTGSITLFLILFSLNGLAEDYNDLPIDCSLEQCKKLAEEFADKSEKERRKVELSRFQAKKLTKMIDSLNLIGQYRSLNINNFSVDREKIEKEGREAEIMAL